MVEAHIILSIRSLSRVMESLSRRRTGFWKLHKSAHHLYLPWKALRSLFTKTTGGSQRLTAVMSFSVMSSSWPFLCGTIPLPLTVGFFVCWGLETSIVLGAYSWICQQ